jgi:hypothetical protein
LDAAEMARKRWKGVGKAEHAEISRSGANAATGNMTPEQRKETRPKGRGITLATEDATQKGRLITAFAFLADRKFNSLQAGERYR